MRWAPRRKAAIVVAIGSGEISVAEAQWRYDLSDEELAAWMRDYDAHGWPGLRSTKFQLYAQIRQPTSVALSPLRPHLAGSTNPWADVTERSHRANPQ